MPEESPSIDKVYQIRAGKLRRYHGEGLKQLLDFKTILLNIRDMFYVVIGTIQAFRILRAERPGVIFIKGGFVAIPVGISANLLKIPYITHDSDSVPGLANRVISKGAALHTVAMPTNVYNYEPRKTIQVGVPVNTNFKNVSASAMAAAKSRLKIPADSKAVLITGGGLGAAGLNTAVAKISKQLTGQGVYMLHMVGPGNSQKVEDQYTANGADMDKVIIKDFVSDLHNYSAASDIVITRAGATTLTEFAIQSKACIVVPNPFLTGGHQTKNAKVLERLGAIEVADSKLVVDDPNTLYLKITDLLKDTKKRQQLSDNISQTVIKDSAKKIVTILTDSGLGK